MQEMIKIKHVNINFNMLIKHFNIIFILKYKCLK
jgi:hypothetical protein